MTPAACVLSSPAGLSPCPQPQCCYRQPERSHLQGRSETGSFRDAPKLGDWVNQGGFAKEPVLELRCGGSQEGGGTEPRHRAEQW